MLRYILFIFLLLPFLAGCQNGAKPCAYQGGKPDYLPAINCSKDFTAIEGKPLSQKYGNVHTVKVVYDLRKDFVYFIHSVKYDLHYNFCNEYLKAYYDVGSFNFMEYGDRKGRRFVLANLNHYESSNIYTLEFFADDKVPMELIKQLYTKIQEKTFFGQSLKVFVNSEEMMRKAPLLPAYVQKITPDSIYHNQTFQALNPKEAYGYLRKVSVKALDSVEVGRRDILLTDGLPNDFPLVQGMITTVFQTPLCHVNVLSTNRGTPNSVLKTAWKHPNIAPLIDKLVFYKVTEDTLILREATLAEAMQVWKSQYQAPTFQLKCNEKVTGLQSLKKLGAKNVDIVGGKAANFAELTRVKLDGVEVFPVPEGGFAIPFSYYLKHIRKAGIHNQINRLLADTAMIYDIPKLKSALKEIRNAIKDAPIDPILLADITRQIENNALPYKYYRFRSSTNAEDIPGFNGAGLYDSKSGAIGDEKKSIEKAVKAVWASLWNLRAFEERDYKGIDQHTIAMGILVHRAFGEDGANGVAITRNIYRKGYPSFTLNVQIGETSVVLPPSDSITCEQMLVHFNEMTTGRSDITAEYISYSSLTDGKKVLDEETLKTLMKLLKAVKNHYYFHSNWGLRVGEYADFGLDIEFKIEKNTGKIYIKQVRYYDMP